MLTRLSAGLLCLVGAVLIALAVASATLWRASDTLVATAEASTGSTMIVTEPGVLDLAADEVTLEATGPGEGVVIALGRSADVAAWVGTDPHTLVTGLTDRERLATAEGTGPTPTDGATTTPEGTASPGATGSAGATATPTPGSTAEATEGTDEEAVDGEGAADADEPAANPAGSDLWLAEEVGTTSARMSWTAEPGRWSVLVASTGEGAGPPTLTMTWPQEVATPWLVPGLVAGSVLLAAGLALVALLALRGRRAAAVRGVPVSQPVAVIPGPVGVSRTGAPTVAPVPAAPGPVPAGAPGPGAASPAPGAPLTRRQLRELERGGTGSVPVVPAPGPVTSAASTSPAGPVTPAGPTPAPGSPVPSGRPTGAAPSARPPAGPPAPTSAAPSTPWSGRPSPASGQGGVPAASGAGRPPTTPPTTPSTTPPVRPTQAPPPEPAVTRSPTGHVPRHGLPESEVPPAGAAPTYRRAHGQTEPTPGGSSSGAQAGPGQGFAAPRAQAAPGTPTSGSPASTTGGPVSPAGTPAPTPAGAGQVPPPADVSGVQRSRLAARFTRRGAAAPERSQAPTVRVAPPEPEPTPAEPTWTPRPGQQGPGASADAWRRAWGFPDAAAGGPPADRSEDTDVHEDTDERGERR